MLAGAPKAPLLCTSLYQPGLASRAARDRTGQESIWLTRLLRAPYHNKRHVGCSAVISGQDYENDSQHYYT